jgi:hypothetical protein
VTLEVLKAHTAITIIKKLRNGKQILVTGNPFFDDQGEISRVVVNERDITELVEVRLFARSHPSFFIRPDVQFVPCQGMMPSFL